MNNNNNSLIKLGQFIIHFTVGFRKGYKEGFDDGCSAGYNGEDQLCCANSVDYYTPSEFYQLGYDTGYLKGYKDGVKGGEDELQEEYISRYGPY